MSLSWRLLFPGCELNFINGSYITCQTTWQALYSTDTVRNGDTVLWQKGTFRVETVNCSSNKHIERRQIHIFWILSTYTMRLQAKKRKKSKIAYKMASLGGDMKLEQPNVWLSEIASCKAEISYSAGTRDTEGSCCVEFCDSVPNLDVEVIRVLRKLNACFFWVFAHTCF